MKTRKIRINQEKKIGENWLFRLISLRLLLLRLLRVSSRVVRRILALSPFELETVRHLYEFPCHFDGATWARELSFPFCLQMMIYLPCLAADCRHRSCSSWCATASRNEPEPRGNFWLPACLCEQLLLASCTQQHSTSTLYGATAAAAANSKRRIKTQLLPRLFVRSPVSRIELSPFFFVSICASSLRSVTYRETAVTVVADVAAGDSESISLWRRLLTTWSNCVGLAAALVYSSLAAAFVIFLLLFSFLLLLLSFAPTVDGWVGWNRVAVPYNNYKDDDWETRAN